MKIVVLGGRLMPMIDAGYMHGGGIDKAERRGWLVIRASDVGEARQRLDDLPFARNGSASFTLTRVKALPIT